MKINIDNILGVVFIFAFLATIFLISRELSKLDNLFPESKKPGWVVDFPEEISEISTDADNPSEMDAYRSGDTIFLRFKQIGSADAHFTNNCR